jgi:hypothetical protein
MSRRIVNWALLLLSCFCVRGQALYQKNLTREQLQNYLSKAVDCQELCALVKHASTKYPGTDDQIVNGLWLTLGPKFNSCSVDGMLYSDVISGREWHRYQALLAMIANVHPKFIADGCSTWGTWEIAEHLNRCKHLVQDMKKIDPDIVVQGSANEWVNAGMVQGISIPEHVLRAFNLPIQKRQFNLPSMIDNPSGVDFNGGFKPIIEKLETQMYFYWLATTYIDLGCESINFSDFKSTIRNKEDYDTWFNLVDLIKKYADHSQAVRFVLVTGHHATGYVNSYNRLLFDFHSEPCRPVEDLHSSYNYIMNGGACMLKAETDPDCKTLYRNGLGGINPSGWLCTRNPGSVFLDNYLCMDADCRANWGRPTNGCSTAPPYHFDEMSWFGLQTEDYRNRWLKYAYYKVKYLDTELRFALPIRRALGAGTNPDQINCNNETKAWWPSYYYAINPDDQLFKKPKTYNNDPQKPVLRSELGLHDGFGQEAVIKDILSGVVNDRDSTLMLEQTLSDNISLTPNLTSGAFTISFNNPFAQAVECVVLVSDATGKLLVKQKESTQGKIFLSLSEYSAGIYFVRIASLFQNTVFKVVKQ